MTTVTRTEYEAPNGVGVTIRLVNQDPRRWAVEKTTASKVGPMGPRVYEIPDWQLEDMVTVNLAPRFAEARKLLASIRMDWPPTEKRPSGKPPANRPRGVGEADMKTYKGLALDQSALVRMTDLADRGWTEAMVSRFLGEPDATRRNPRYRSAAPMRFWLASRASESEVTPEWAAAREASERRRAVGLKVAERKEAETLAMVERMPVSVGQYDRGTLVARACESYNAHQADVASRRGDYENHDTTEEASPDSDGAFLDRICVNFLRHEATPYEDGLDRLYRQVGVAEGSRLWRGRVYQVIAQQYPYLAAQCADQQPTRSIFSEWAAAHGYEASLGD